MGAEGYRVDDAASLEKVLKDCLIRDALAVIDVPVDYAGNKDLLRPTGTS